jgi:hypothetical protein
VQKFKTLLDNKSEGVSHQTYFTIWLAFFLRLHLTVPGSGAWKEEKEWSGWDLNSKFFFHRCCF